MKVAVHCDVTSRRSMHIADAMARGIARAGDTFVRYGGFDEPVCADACVAYGWARPDLFEAYRDRGLSYVHVDLGWWNRKPHNNPLAGAHKTIVNCREPDDVSQYFRGPLDRARLDRAGIGVADWQQVTRRAHILVAGMSAKCAATYWLKPEEWERGAIDALRRVLWVKGGLDEPPLRYRPKPSWPDWTHFPSVVTSPPTQALADALADCRAVVTHHSNVALDALIAGVPICVERGVCTPFSTPMCRLWDPIKPDGRLDLLTAISWMQWTPTEMASGECWTVLKESTDLECARSS